MRSLIVETTLILFVTVVIYLLDPQASQLLAYYHTGIAQFELWRLISATFCHTNFNHLLMNAAGLIITLLLFIDTFKLMKIFPIIIFNSIFIGSALFLLEPQVSWYVGLSGVLHGLFSYGVTNDISNKDRWGYLLGTGFIVKIIYEQMFGAQQATIDLINAPVLVNAHFYGAIAGLIFYVINLTYKNRKR
jgi:rhomboid family GlyGly-CTERM serine protease